MKSVGNHDEDLVEVIAESLECKNPTVLGGFPGMGLVGNIVTQHLIEQFKMKNVGFVDSKLFPPVAVIYGGRVKGAVRIYESAEKELVVLFSDIPIEPLISKEVGSTIVQWIKTLNPKEVVSIAGLATPGLDYNVYCAATTDEEFEKIKDVALTFEMGTIAGVPGVLMNECMEHDIPAYCLLGETRGPNPDPRAAAEVVKALNKIYGWDISTEPLMEQADQIEKLLHKLSEQMAQTEKKPGKDFTMYG
ncbi:proteasome assembly chaperone family protein [Methanocella sp. CWC-04]|uniref:Proteasome assembly chaperone family protein n=2 Tax=Methanooceanicella nereidis TaxID=2052831 RepID=A0AAP2RCM0_9EURY|nr:proteasome assembly chaperone family protein [Methanocella sp. CWC-04]